MKLNVFAVLLCLLSTSLFSSTIINCENKKGDKFIFSNFILNGYMYSNIKYNYDGGTYLNYSTSWDMSVAKVRPKFEVSWITNDKSKNYTADNIDLVHISFWNTDNTGPEESWFHDYSVYLRKNKKSKKWDIKIEGEKGGPLVVPAEEENIFKKKECIVNIKIP